MPTGSKRNMSDVFRKVYTPISEEKKARIESIKDKAQELYDLIAGDPNEGMSGDTARMLALAKTNLEQSIMWAVKGLTS